MAQDKRTKEVLLKDLAKAEKALGVAKAAAKKATADADKAKARLKDAKAADRKGLQVAKSTNPDAFSVVVNAHDVVVVDKGLGGNIDHRHTRTEGKNVVIEVREV